MSIPAQVTFHNIESSPSIDDAVQKRVQKLEQFCDSISRCRVTIEAPHKHHSKGNTYHVTVDVRLPGGEIVVNRDHGENHAHEDVYVAIRDAFNATDRQLQDHVRIRRRKVKRHEVQLHGRITTLRPDKDFGRILTSGGRDIYFHRNSLLDADFDALETGMEVRFDEEQGDNGPQATSVHLIGKHHLVG